MAGRAFWEFDDTFEAYVAGLYEMEIGSIGRLQTGKIALQQIQSIVGVQQSSTLRHHLFVTGRIFDGHTDAFLSDLIDGQLIDGIDGIIVYLLVLQHARIASLIRENHIPRVFLTGSPLYLNIGLEAKGRIK